jgi:putative serine protease PepD
MDREPAGSEDDGSPAPRGGPTRRLIAVAAAIAVLLVAVAVLATRLADAGSATAAGSPSPSPSASPSSTSLTISSIYQRVQPSVVTVRTPHDFGAGVVVTDTGLIVTADHVIAGAKTIRVTFADGTTTAAAVVTADAKTDIAELLPAKLPSVVVPATLGGAASVGAAVVAVGNPLGLTDSVSSGVVSGLNRSADTDTGQRSGLIQFDAAVNPGSSGGPLLDNDGRVIGIVVALADPDGQDAFAGIGFAVPIGSALGGTGNGPGKGPQI